MRSIAIKNHKLPLINGDLFTYVDILIKEGNSGSSVIVPHVCNNINSFGAGFALAVSKHYPIVKENYHMLGNTFLKNNLGYVQFIEVANNLTFGHKLIFANMIAQDGIIGPNNPRPLNYLSLCKSMISVKNYATQHFEHKDKKVQIHAPKFGSGLSGGNWSFISELIKDIWNNIDIFIYCHK